MEKEIKCAYCDNKATHTRTIDLDIKWIPLCDDKWCYVEYLINTTDVRL